MSRNITIIISNASIILTTVILNPIFTIPNILSLIYTNPIPIITQTLIPSGPPRSGLYLRNTSIPLIPCRLTTRGKQIFDLPRQVRSIFTSLIDCIHTITTIDITSHSIQDTHTISSL